MRTLLLLIAGILLTTGGARAEGDASSLVAQGDKLDAKNQNARALVLYMEADKLSPNNADILWRLSKQYCQLMEEEVSGGEKLRLARIGVYYAKRAKAADPDNANGRLALSIAIGKASFYNEPRERVEDATRIRDEAQAAADLNPNLDYAWHVLGRWNYEMSTMNGLVKFLAEKWYKEFPESSLEAAVEYFKKAIAIDPKRVVHHVELGRTYAALGKKEQARAELEKGIALPSVAKDDEETKTRAKLALSRLTGSFL